MEMNLDHWRAIRGENVYGQAKKDEAEAKAVRDDDYEGDKDGR